MQQPIRFLWQQQTLWLSHERCIYWEDTQTLLLSDLHLGKSGHFRKAGVGIPQGVFKEDMQRLAALIQFFKPLQIVVVGDLFHSRDNKEHDFFVRWRHDFANTRFILVKGNHDILEAGFYEKAGLEVITELLTMPPFAFVHDAAALNPSPPEYLFSGHLHPGILLSGAGKQSLRLPCFYFGQTGAVLPAFGKFTGTYLVEPGAGKKIFAIAGKNVMEL